MIGYWENNKYFAPPEPEALEMMQYRDHVANGTAPKKGIPYTKQGKVIRKIPSLVYATNTSNYIKEFNQLNHLKDF